MTKLRTKKSKKLDGINKEKLIQMTGDLALIPKNYQMQDTYFPGDYIEHGKFGKGIVEALIGSDKIKIIFFTGDKILMHTTNLTSINK